MYGIGWFEQFFTTRTSVSMDIEQQTKRMMTRHDYTWLCFFLPQENGCSGGENFLKSTESVHCTFSIHFFEVSPGPDLHKWQEWLYSKEYLVFVDRGQERVRKSVLEQCNVWTRLISKNFYHRNIRFLGATRSKVISHRVGSSSSWSVVRRKAYTCSSYIDVFNRLFSTLGRFGI